MTQHTNQKTYRNFSSIDLEIAAQASARKQASERQLLNAHTRKIKGQHLLAKLRIGHFARQFVKAVRNTISNDRVREA